MRLHRILIGTLGDDIHTVGMALLSLALRESGFSVTSIGIGNQLDDFFLAARDHSAILISCNNGHAELYLDAFAPKLALFRHTSHGRRLWYLGGNLSVSKAEDEIVQKYTAMGFTFVTPRPVPWQHVVSRLRDDFERFKIPRFDSMGNEETQRTVAVVENLGDVDDEPLSDLEFGSLRRAVLESWPTGQGVAEAAPKANHEKAKNLHELIESRRGVGGPLLQPRTGVALVDDEIDLLLNLQGAGMEVASIQLDAASRKNLYAQAEEGVKRTVPGGRSFLNGYPVVAHGVDGIRKIVASIQIPFQIRAGSPDHRLVYEIGLAGGTSSVEGGFLCYLLPYDKRTSPATNLQYWKYVDKLASHYFEHHQVVVNREYFGALTTTLIPPCMAIVINVVQALLSARSGVKCISVGLAEQGSRIQDVAALRVLERSTREYLCRFGYPDVCVSTVFHQYMAAFPKLEDRARELIVESSTTAALAGASRMMIKSPVEAISIPRRQDNAEALELSRRGIRLAANVALDPRSIAEEENIIHAEVTSLMSAIEELGRGSHARGAIMALQAGWIDVPFSPSSYNSGGLISARDCDGAIRIWNAERFPFPTKVIDFHKERINQRMTLERRSRMAELIQSDLVRISRCDFLRWPLDGVYVS